MHQNMHKKHTYIRTYICKCPCLTFACILRMHTYISMHTWKCFHLHNCMNTRQQIDAGCPSIHTDPHTHTHTHRRPHRHKCRFIHPTCMRACIRNFIHHYLRTSVHLYMHLSIRQFRHTQRWPSIHHVWFKLSRTFCIHGANGRMIHCEIRTTGRQTGIRQSKFGSKLAGLGWLKYAFFTFQRANQNGNYVMVHEAVFCSSCLDKLRGWEQWKVV